MGTHWKSLNETLPMSTITNDYIENENYINFFWLRKTCVFKGYVELVLESTNYGSF